MNEEQKKAVARILDQANIIAAEGVGTDDPFFADILVLLKIIEWQEGEIVNQKNVSLRHQDVGSAAIKLNRNVFVVRERFCKKLVALQADLFRLRAAVELLEAAR